MSKPYRGSKNQPEINTWHDSAAEEKTARLHEMISNINSLESARSAYEVVMGAMAGTLEVGNDQEKEVIVNTFLTLVGKVKNVFLLEEHRDNREFGLLSKQILAVARLYDYGIKQGSE